MTTTIAAAGATHPITTLRTLGVMVARDLRVIRRNIPELITRSVMQPLGWAFVLAYVLPKIGVGAMTGPGGGATQVSYSTILAPGLVASTLALQGLMFTTLSLITEFAYNRDIDDKVLAPTPIWVLGVHRIVSGAMKALLSALIVFPIVMVVHAGGQGPKLHINWLLLLVALPLSCMLISSIGLLFGCAMEVTAAQGLILVLITPLTMLGCVYFPWSALHRIPWLMVVSLANPLVYVSEAMRAALTPQVGHMPTPVILSVLVVATAGFGWLAIRQFQRRVLG